MWNEKSSKDNFRYLNPKKNNLFSLDHFLDEPVNLVSLLSEGAIFVEVVQLLSESPSPGIVQLEGPQEICGSLKVKVLLCKSHG